MYTNTAKNSISRIMLLTVALMFMLSVAFVSPAFMQQQGGPYTMTRSVIAGGGRSSSNNNTALTGTVGQAVLGMSSGNNFSLKSGFWQSEPAGMETISGNITYCVSPVPVGVPNVTLNLTGGSSTTSDSLGNYQFSSLAPSGSYTITPSKAGAASGINAQDIGRIRRFVALLDSPTACQTIAANVDNANPSVNAQDVGVLRRYVALLPNTGDAGTWKFNPVSQIVAGQPGSQTANFDAILVGDIDGNWTPSAPQGGKASPQLPAVNLTVSFPNISANQGTTVFVPVTVTGTLTSGDNVLGYTLDLTFNQSIVTTVADPGQSFSIAGSISAAGIVTENKTLSANRLRLVVDFNNPLVFSGAQTLIYIALNVIGSPGQTSNLSWNPALPPEFGNGPPNITTSPINGTLTVSSPSVVRLSSFTATAYDNGVYLEWQTGMEGDNLGFNVYRESSGRRELLTPDIIAGSALLTGSTSLLTGRSYSWWDKPANQQSAQYWLEDVDLNGNRMLHGPFGVQQKSGKPPARSAAETLSQIGRTPGRSTQARALHPIAGSERRFQQQDELAAGSAVKMSIREEGWYSVKRQDLLVAGLDPNADPRNLQLYLHGQQVPISVIGVEGRTFDGIEFYATGQDTPSTDAHVYWLIVAVNAGSRIKHLKGDGVRQTATGFPFIIERRDRTIYFSGLRNGDKENFFGPVISQAPVEQVLSLSHLDSSSAGAARIEVKLQGVTMAAHLVGVQLNGTHIGQVTFNAQSEGTVSLNVPQSQLREGINSIIFNAQGGPSDISLVGSVRITYQHAFNADEDSLRFIAPGNQQVRIAGFSSPAIRVIDITDPDAPEEIEGQVDEDKSGFGVTVARPAAGDRTLFAFSESQKKHPSSVIANVPSGWRLKEQSADLLIIARRDFFEAAENLKMARQKRGYKVAVVDVEDIYDEFNYGEKSPQTMKDFLSFAGNNWKVAPRFVLMLGDASFDSRNYLGVGDFDLVPTKLVDTEFMETASDDWFADFNNDGIAEMAVGRLAARTPLEADVMITKILAYATARPAEEALLVVDINDVYDFEAATRQLRVLLPSTLRIEEIDRSGLDPATAKRRLLEGINRGPLVVNYAGHGNVDVWRGELLTSDDAGSLANSERPALFVMMTCLNGYFQDPLLDGLAESLMKIERGGAVAVWASSGMTLPMEQWLMNEQLYRLLFGRGGLTAPPMTLGEAVMRAKASIGDQDIRRTWILFGDPTMQVK
jgi:Peptidase family C25